MAAPAAAPAAVPAVVALPVAVHAAVLTRVGVPAGYFEWLGQLSPASGLFYCGT